jgi:osmotically-inducible protein OsmY
MFTDQEIFKNVTQKLEFDPRIDPSNIIIAVKDGIVTLTGTVHTYAGKSIVEDDVKSIKGVKGIAEELKVDFYGYQRERTDTDIARAARYALEWDVMIPEEKIQVIVEVGVVTLTGEASYNYQRDAAVSAVRNLKGVKNVINRISLKPSINPQEIKSRISKEFERNAHIDASKVSVEAEDSKIILQRTVRSWAEKNEAVKVAWSIPGVKNVENLITLSYW